MYKVEENNLYTDVAVLTCHVFFSIYGVFFLPSYSIFVRQMEDLSPPGRPHKLTDENIKPFSNK